MKKKRGIVVSPRASDYPDPLRLRAGEKVAVGEKMSPWPGWTWITASGGKSGWSPETFIRRSASGGTVLRDYDATELNVERGEELVVLDEVAGWYWCTNKSGRSGWVPVENIALL